MGQFPRTLLGKLGPSNLESLKEALEEAKPRKPLEDEEDSKKRVQAVIKDHRPAKQEERGKTKKNRRGMRGLVCWRCSEERHVLKNCKLWKEFKKGKHKTNEVVVKPELNLNWDH